MTIKQNGGIFGRNPTFNDVEIQGTLTTSGSVSQSGDFTVDTNTFVVDTTNDRVGVNISSPTEALHVNGNIILNDGSFGPGDSHSVAIGDLNAFIKSTQGSPIAFGAYHGYTFNFASAGDLTTNGEWVRIDSDGLKFNGDTAAANALSDYEEGTWTPVVYGSSGAGTASYSSQKGNYTKVGNLVYASGRVSYSSHTGTGNMRMSGLPFTSSNTNTLEPPFIIFGSDISLTANNYMVGTTRYNASYVEILQTPTGGGSYANVSMDAAGSMFFTIIYQAA